DDLALARAEEGCLHPRLAAFELSQFLAGPQVPQRGGPQRGGQRLVAVRREGHAEDRAGTGQRAHLLAGGRLPDASAAVVPAEADAAAVGGHGHGMDRGSVPLEPPDLDEDAPADGLGQGSGALADFQVRTAQCLQETGVGWFADAVERLLCRLALGETRTA